MNLNDKNCMLEVYLEYLVKKIPDLLCEEVGFVKVDPSFKVYYIMNQEGRFVVASTNFSKYMDKRVKNVRKKEKRSVYFQTPLNKECRILNDKVSKELTKHYNGQNSLIRMGETGDILAVEKYLSATN